MSHADGEERSEAVTSFLTAGVDEPPARAVMVDALVRARRSVAERRRSGGSPEEWLEKLGKASGVAESAAYLAVLENISDRDPIAQMFLERHPDRSDVLIRLLRVI